MNMILFIQGILVTFLCFIFRNYQLVLIIASLLMPLIEIRQLCRNFLLIQDLDPPLENIVNICFKFDYLDGLILFNFVILLILGGLYGSFGINFIFEGLDMRSATDTQLVLKLMEFSANVIIICLYINFVSIPLF